MTSEQRIEFSSGYWATLDVLINTAIRPAAMAKELDLSLEEYVSQLRSWFAEHREYNLRVTDNGTILLGLQQREEVTRMETPNPTPPETPGEGDGGEGAQPESAPEQTPNDE